MRFRDRNQAGELLGDALAKRRLEDPVVLGLARGGVPIAAHVARRLDAPFDVFISRKIGSPENPEYGLGAIAEGGIRWLDDESIQRLGIDDQVLERLIVDEKHRVERRVARYRRGRSLPDLRHRPVILVDDGIATGGTVQAAVRALRAEGAGYLILAVPVAAPASYAAISALVDDIVCLSRPADMHAIGAWYDDFEQVSDDEVVRLIDARNAPRQARDVLVPAGQVTLEGLLMVPRGATGLVVIAHGMYSSRLSAQNRELAETFAEVGLASLRVDLLTGEEVATDALDAASHRFDIDLLGERLVRTMDWLGATWPEARIGLFAGSTAGGAALVAASRRPEKTAAVVSLGGRPDLALPFLSRVVAPVLFLVGGADREVLELNRQAALAMAKPPQVDIIAGATHLFTEPGVLEEAAQRARAFLLLHLERGAWTGASL